MFLFAKAHEHGVTGNLMEPGGEGGLSPELADAAEHGEKSLLSQIFSLCWIFHHAQTEGVDPSIMPAIEKIKCSRVALLSQTQRLAL